MWGKVMRNVTDIDISVIIPIFNGEKWINRCIMSIESQLFKGIETVSYTHLTLPTTSRV